MWRMADLSEAELAMAQARTLTLAADNIETRYQRGAFQKHVNRLCFVCQDIPPTKLRLIYEEIMGVHAVDGKERAPALARLQSLLTSPDVADSLAVLADFRHENGNDFEYNGFYQAAMALLAQEPAPTAKRTGANVLPFARSAEELMQKVIESRPEGAEEIPIPSVSYFRKWFLPRAAHQKSLGLIPFRRAIASRDATAPNVDEHYNNALHKYVRSFACDVNRGQGRGAAAFRSLDDKAKIIVAEPDAGATSALVRPSATIAPKGQEPVVGGHDFTKLSITPSVELDVVVPPGVQDSFLPREVDHSV